MQLLTPDTGLIFWTLVVFISIYLALKKFVWPVILNTVKQREKDIAEAMETARQLKEQIAVSKKEHAQFMKQAYESKEAVMMEANEAAIKMIMIAKQEARQKCEGLVDSALQAIRKQKDDSLAEALLNVESLAMEASERLLHPKRAKEIESKTE